MLSSEIERIEQPKYQSTLIVVPGIHINFERAMPCWWWRLWQRALLGFRWESVK